MVLLRLVDLLFTLLYALIIIDVILSWLPGARDTSAGVAIHRMVRPILEPIRRLIPPLGGMIDISPLIALLLLTLLRRLVTDLLISAAF